MTDGVTPETITTTNDDVIVENESNLPRLKAIFTIAASKQRMFNTATSELQEITEILRDAITSNRMASDEDFRKFVSDELALGLMQKCAKCISMDNNYVNACAELLGTFIDFFANELKNQRYHENFTCAMTWCFQPESSLHKKNFQMSDNDLKKLSTSRQAWRKELQVGNDIDFKVLGDNKGGKTKGWCQAKIQRIEGDVLYVTFPGFPSDWEESVETWSTDLAPFESHTKEDYAWRREAILGVDNLENFVIDCHDDYKWEEATIFNLHEEIDHQNNSTVLGNIGFRVYRNWGNKMRKDEKTGEMYDGWSSKFDDYINVFSHKIQKHMSRVGQSVLVEEDFDDELDDLMVPKPGHSRIYCVPRLQSCISSKFIDFMNQFGHNGGFAAILDTLENKVPDENLSLTTMGYMITMISMPSKLFHKDYISEIAARFASAMKRQILESPDKILKNVTPGDVNQIQISINSINARIMDKDQSKQEQEKLKLEICKKCLASDLLERRILGIKELNTIIRNSQMTYAANKVFSIEQLISFMNEHGVFDILWDPKKTHLQLVQRSGEIFKVLPKENLLTMELLSQFWSLSKSDYKSEIFKIINDSAFHFEQDHIEYLFNQVTETPASKLGMEEFDVLSSLGRFCRNNEFQNQISEFFLRIINNSDDYNAEVIENCINKFADMIKFHTLEKKMPYFNQLIGQLQNTQSSALPVIRLYTQIIKDQKSRGVYGNSGGNVTGGTVNYAADDDDDEDEENKQNINTATTEQQITLKSILNELVEKSGFAEALLSNMGAYCRDVTQKVQREPVLLQEQDRSKMNIVSAKHSHQDEISSRLSFLQEFAVNSDYQISKAQLRVIYDLLSQSPIKSDFTEFYKWCNTACQAYVLNLEEVGEFFSELIKSNDLNLKLLPIVGFNFLSMYFISQNYLEDKLAKIQKPTKKKSWSTTQSNYGGQYGARDPNYYNNQIDDDDDKDDVMVEQDDDPIMKINVEPSGLTKIDMIWQIALEVQDGEVMKKAVAFLVNCYLSVSSTLEERRNEILQSLNSRCFELISQSRENPQLIKRIVTILQCVIKISEKKGTGGVQPHNAILKGEMLDRIIIRYMVKNTQNYWGGLKLDRSVVVKLYTSATVWEFKKEVSQILGLSPKYIKLTLPNKELIRDNQHGMTLQELKLKNGDILNAEKLAVANEKITQAPLIDRMKRCLVPRAAEIFTEWFHIYKDPSNNMMGSQEVANFIAGATKQTCTPDDKRVEGIVDKWDRDNDGLMSLKDFLDFYYDACSGPGLKAVQSNLTSHNVRLDLKKMSEITEEVDYAANEMPRHTLSANQDQFQALLSLLERNDEASENVWNLVRMLATNQTIYQEVLSMSEAQQEGTIDWARVFEDSSLYKQIYKQEIIVAVMEASKLGLDNQRVMFVEEQRVGGGNTTYGRKDTSDFGQAGGAQDDEEFKDDENATEDMVEDIKDKRNEGLKANWTKQFFEQDGFSFILSSFLAKKLSSKDSVTFSEQGGLKDIAFLTTLLRVFLQAGFNAQDSQIGNSIQLVRKSSSLADEHDIPSNKNDEDQLVKLMGSPEGQDIMLNTDFEQLLAKTLELLTTIISKSSLILEDKIIIENSISIMMGTMLYKKELFANFIGFKNNDDKIQNAEQLVLAALLHQEEKVRLDFSRALGVLSINMCKSGDNCLQFLLGVLARNLASIQNRPSHQFFELFNKLIDQKAIRDQIMGDAADDSSAIYNPEDLLNQIIDKIKVQQKLKQDQAAAAGDAGEDELKALEITAEQERLLVGLVTLTGKIIAKADKSVSDRIIVEKDLIGQIFKEFLFASYFQAVQDNVGNAVVLQQQSGSRTDAKKTAAPTNKSREAAYELLHQLIKNSSTLMTTFLDSQLVPLIQTIKRPKTWNYSTQTQSQRYQKYVGLRNLGCICYMNSMMQQFFMTPAFRYNLLCVDDGKPEELKEFKGEQVDDNMMHQLQKLITHLELSERSEYNPYQFCFAFKEFDGSPTNVSEQKDSQEFLNVFFDRLENALKPTSRKHLIQGVFGGQQCSQMVCTECGKVKNRMEDYLNLSIPIKGFKSIEESLQKQIEGEIINDYHCDGCNRKVDLQKRSMIASTPNILIVHLQRICFNFDTFQNDKINSFCSFPNVLDLQPYSFHEVMAKENRLKEQQDTEETSAFSNQVAGQNEDDLTEEEILKRKELEEETREPERDDCYEYKLVGVNVHSGTANAGHYWSYINTNRGVDEKKDDTTWIKTEADIWNEYNDSRVSDWEFKELEQRTFGNAPKSNNNGYFSALGDSYGTSAYMLFYERRQKKDLKIIVPEDKIEEQKAKGINVQYDEEKKENFKMCPYRSAADGELANEIYMKVAEDNMKYTFESDIYSTEFFDFILQILQSVATSDVDGETKLNGMKIGRKVGFEILARMMVNPGIEKVSQVMIDILKSKPEITKPFIASMCEMETSEVLWEVLLECSDKNAQKHLARVIKYALCQLKIQEKESALSQETETVTETFTDTDGNVQETQVQRPKAICIRFVTLMTQLLEDRAPKNWRKFDSFLSIFLDFMVFSADDIDKQKVKYDTNCEEFKVGVELYYIYNMIRYLGDFILQENSPYSEPGQIRQSMGGNYGNPNLGSVLKTIILMISDRAMVQKYPLEEKNQAVVAHKDILQKMIEPSDPNSDFSDVLFNMAHDNEKVSKKLAKAYLKGVNKTAVEQLSMALRQIRLFLKIDDSLRMQRFEWIFGLPQILSKTNFRTKSQQYGKELLELISDEYCQFKSVAMKGVTDGFLGQLFKAKGKMDTQCVHGLRALVEMMVEDEDVAKYIFSQPSPSLQYARYTDWFFIYAQALQVSTLKQISNTTTMLDYHKSRLEALDAIMDKREAVEAMFNRWIEEQRTQIANMGADQFQQFREHTLYGTVDGIIPSYPPAYFVGATVYESAEVIMTSENELATVTLEQVSCEFMYSNPTGLFNLSAAEKMSKAPVGYNTINYQSWKMQQLRDRYNEAADEDAELPSQDDIVTKTWVVDKARAPCILRVMTKSKASKMVRVSVKLTVTDNEKKNVVFPISTIKENLFSNDSKQALVFLKIDPTKESWGDIQMEVSVKPGKTLGMSSGGTSYGASGGSYGGSGDTGFYVSSSVGMNVQGQSYETTNYSTPVDAYRPNGYTEDDSFEVSCIHCNAECFAGQDWCGSCGKSPVDADIL